jgi:GntR family transcriptional repressor for pyruvate dehydrogenase complex
MAEREATSTAVNAVVADIAAIAGQVGDLKSDRIVTAFERQIFSGRLPAGAKLPAEAELCELMGVSRSVVRDSVRTLVARGLVTVRQGRGTTVAEPSDAAYGNALLALLTRSDLTMGDVVTARATIEMALVASAAKNGTEEDWVKLEEAYDGFAEAVSRDDADVATRCHAAFHARILDAVRQPALSLILRPMSDLTIVSSSASVRRSSPGDWEVESHAPIMRALRAGDPEAATRAMQAHWEVSTRPKPYRAFLAQPVADAFFNNL